MTETTEMEVHFVFDEGIVKNTMGIICCAVFIGNDFFEQTKTLLEEVQQKPMFGILKNSFPHYCEDHPSQRWFILDELRYLHFRSYAVIKSYENEVSDTKLLYKELLWGFIGNLLQKFVKIYWSGTKFKLLFENLTSNKEDDENYLKECLLGLESTFDYDLCVLSKNEKHGIVFIPDYICWSLKDFLIIKEDGRAAWDMIFSNLLEWIWMGYIQFVGSSWTQHFKTSLKDDKEKFIQQFRWILGTVEK